MLNKVNLVISLQDRMTERDEGDTNGSNHLEDF